MPITSSDAPKFAMRADGKIGIRSSDGKAKLQVTSGAACGCGRSCSPMPTIGLPNTFVARITLKRYLCQRKPTSTGSNVITFVDGTTSDITLTRRSGFPTTLSDAWDSATDPTSAVHSISMGFSCGNAARGCTDSEWGISLYGRAAPGTSAGASGFFDLHPGLYPAQTSDTPVGVWMPDIYLYDYCNSSVASANTDPPPCTTGPTYPYAVSTVSVLTYLEII